MTEISEAAKAKACEACNVTSLEDGVEANWTLEEADEFANVRAFARFIQQVSDAAKEADELLRMGGKSTMFLAPFILPEPVDPLVLAFRTAYGHEDANTVEKLRKALDRCGLKIVEATDAQG